MKACQLMEKQLLDDLYNVGKKKSLGYLPVETLTEMCNKSILDMVDYANKNELKWIIFDYKDCVIGGGAIYMYDETMLNKILKEYSSVLTNSGVPCDSCDNYINYISKHIVSERKYPEAHRVIGLTFNDIRYRHHLEK